MVSETIVETIGSIAQQVATETLRSAGEMGHAAAAPLVLGLSGAAVGLGIGAKIGNSLVPDNSIPGDGAFGVLFNACANIIGGGIGAIAGGVYGAKAGNIVGIDGLISAGQWLCGGTISAISSVSGVAYSTASSVTSPLANAAIDAATSITREQLGTLAIAATAVAAVVGTTSYMMNSKNTSQEGRVSPVLFEALKGLDEKQALDAINAGKKVASNPNNSKIVLAAVKEVTDSFQQNPPPPEKLQEIANSSNKLTAETVKDIGKETEPENITHVQRLSNKGNSSSLTNGSIV